MNQNNNGLINMNGNKINYVNQSEKNNWSCNFSSEALSHNIETNQLSELFFSEQNINFLHLGIKNQILNKTQGKYNIVKQNERELKIIMRGIYMTHNQPEFDPRIFHPGFKKDFIPLNEQVKKLNIKVLDLSVNKIISNIKQKNQYLKDIQKLPEPLEHPLQMSDIGKKDLEWGKEINFT